MATITSAPNGSSQSNTGPDDLTIALVACKRILTKLSLISDAPTGHIRTEGRLAHGTGSDGLRTRDRHGLPVKGEKSSASRVPEGVRLNGNLTGAPSRQFSLYGHYAYRMEQARSRRDASTLLRLAACATRDYEVYAHIRPAFHPDHETAVAELLTNCRGLSAVEATWWTGAPEKWVRRQRVLAGFDAEFGDTQRKDPRLEKALALRAQGVKQAVIAEELGISQQRVSQLLAGSVTY